MPAPLPSPTDPTAPPKARLCCSIRLMTSFIAMLALFLNYCIVFSLAFALLCMTRQTGRHARHLPTAEDEPEFYWDKVTIGLLQSSFYLGFAITLTMGGFVADLYKAKLVLVLGNLLQGALSIALPEFTRLCGAPGLGALRILQGLASGVVVPCVYVLLSKWAAAPERTRLLGVAYLGIPLSEMFIFPLSGFLCGVDCDGGWPLIFYILGVITVMFTLLIQFLVFEWPSQHPLVSEKEKEYLNFYALKPKKKLLYYKHVIRSVFFVLGAGVFDVGHYITQGEIQKTPPWKEMFKSGAVWSYLICYLSQQWGFQVMSVFTPEFMVDVLDFNIHDNGLLSAVPYIGMLIMRATQTNLFNLIREKSHLSLTTLRKINHGIGTCVPAAALVCMNFVHQSPTACVVLLTINMTIQDLAFTGGFGFCNVDFAPAFAGILSGIGMSASVALCILMPNIVTAITPNGSHSEWMTVFYITAASYLVAFIVYNRAGTSDLQPWGLGRSEMELAKAAAKSGEDAPKATQA